MAKELLLYGAMYSWNIESFIQDMEAAKGQDITLRINSQGGDVTDSWGAIAKFSEHKKNKLAKVDGEASSMALYFLCFCEDAEALNVSTGILHRAAYSSYFEQGDNITQSHWDSLAATNKFLRAALEAKIDVPKFVALKGVTLDQVFATDSRLDVELSADEMLQIGLVNRVVQLTAGIEAEVNGRVDRIAATATGKLPIKKVSAIPPPPIIQPKNSNIMTVEELKRDHPGVYAAIFGEGKAAGVTEGVAAERDRVEACLVFHDVDPKGVKQAIASGKPLSAKQMAEFSMKQMSPEALKKLAAESAKQVTTEETTTEKTAEQKEVDDVKARVQAELDKNKPKA